MNNAISMIRREVEKLSPREKILGLIVLFTLVGYLSYTYIFATTFQRLVDTGQAIIALKTELNGQAKVKQRAMELEQQLEDLKSELEGKQFEFQDSEEALKAQNQISKVLGTLEKTAKKLSLELENITVQTNAITKSQEYAEEPMPGAKKGKGETGGEITKNVRVKYIHNIVHITCLSQYRAVLEYLAKIKELPYALSILSIEMTGQKSKSADTVRTTIDMEIFFK